VDKIQRLKIDKIVDHNKTVSQIKLIQLRRIRERIINGHAEALIDEYKEIVKKNKEIAIFTHAIRLGQNYDTNIRRVNRIRQRRQIIINHITKRFKNGNSRTRTNSGKPRERSEQGGRHSNRPKTK
jgi:hypothetical protein